MPKMVISSEFSLKSCVNGVDSGSAKVEKRTWLASGLHPKSCSREPCTPSFIPLLRLYLHFHLLRMSESQQPLQAKTAWELVHLRMETPSFQSLVGQQLPHHAPLSLEQLKSSTNHACGMPQSTHLACNANKHLKTKDSKGGGRPSAAKIGLQGLAYSHSMQKHSPAHSFAVFKLAPFPSLSSHTERSVNANSHQRPMARQGVLRSGGSARQTFTQTENGADGTGMKTNVHRERCDNHWLRKKNTNPCVTSLYMYAYSSAHGKEREHGPYVHKSSRFSPMTARPHGKNSQKHQPLKKPNGPRGKIRLPRHIQAAAALHFLMPLSH